MITVGITGNAGAGKSEVAAAWLEQGIEVIDADEVAHQVLDEDRELRRKLAIEFGDQVLEPSASAEVGSINRLELARRAFATPEGTRALNRIVHPTILARLSQRLADARHRAAHAAGQETPSRRLVAVDAALIFETGAEELFDRIILVTAPPATRIARLRQRGLNEAQIAGVIVGQVSDTQKVDRADYVIHNQGSVEELRAEALEVLTRLLSSPAGEASRSRKHPSPGPRR